MTIWATDEIIRFRQQEIFNRVQEIEQEIRRLEAELNKLRNEKERLIAEHDLLDRFHDRSGIISVTTTTTVTRMTSRDRLTFEDVLKRIFEHAGRPMRMIEIIHELEKYGYKWSCYESAHSYISRLPHIEKIPQCRGFYQWVRV